jgi:hypothetical protein
VLRDRHSPIRPLGRDGEIEHLLLTRVFEVLALLGNQRVEVLFDFRPSGDGVLPVLREIGIGSGIG